MTEPETTESVHSGEGPENTAERQWKFTQWFRKMQNEQTVEGQADDANYITAVEFDDSGNYLATGDKSGNVVVLQNNPDQAREKNELVHYSFFSEFESHVVEFDFVRSIQIEERINQIKWGPKTNDSLFLLATNDRQIKLWKVTEREPIQYANWNVFQPPSNLGASQPLTDFAPLNLRPANVVTELRVPRIIKDQLSTVTTLKKLYSTDPHTFNITTLSVSPDKENFLSGDNLKINLWDLYRQEKTYNIVDMTPTNMQELCEIITTVDFHPAEPSFFLHGSNTGNIRLCDMRTRSIADSAAKTFTTFRKDKIGTPAFAGGMPGENPMDQMSPSLFDEVTSGVSAAKFSKGGRFIITRDYMSIKIWDMNYEKKPVETLYVHEYLREKLMELYQSELLWDTFGLGVSSRGDIVTGSYSNYFHLFDLGGKQDVFIQASKAPETVSKLNLHNKKRTVKYNIGQQNSTGGKKRTGFKLTSIFGGSRRKPQQNQQSSSKDDYPHNIPFNSIEFNKKILDCGWHPESNAVAIAGQNNLFVYSK